MTIIKLNYFGKFHTSDDPIYSTRLASWLLGGGVRRASGVRRGAGGGGRGPDGGGEVPGAKKLYAVAVYGETFENVGGMLD